jgi:hypothetical protein
MKIYSDDANLPYKTTRINHLHTKAEIDGLLAFWGITKVMWDWDLPHNHVTLNFQVNEKFGESQISPVVHLECPLIWDKKGRRGGVEEVNWNISLRLLHWFIKNALAWAYTSQSEKTVAFLPYVAVKEGVQLKDVIKQNLDRIQELPALTEEKLSKVITVEKQ